MKQRTNQILYSYWNEVRGNRIAPRRFDIEPARIAAILPETFILEHNGAASFRFRLAGTRICEQFGHELRHRNFLDLIPGVERYTLEYELGIVALRAAVSLSEFEISLRSGDSARCEVLILPLADPRDAVTRFLGAMSCSGTHDRLDPFPIAIRSLIRHELIWPDGRPQLPYERAHRQPPLPPHTSPSRIVKAQRRQFLVFEGGRSDSPSHKP
ncbi:MAG: PAS domain-containing protein [Bacteroidota bacterium]|jgi:hypothetical protein